MSTTRNAGTEYPISLWPTTTIATKLLLVSALAVIALCLFTTPARAQYGPLSLGQVTGIQSSSTACLASGWASGINCYTATVTSCANISNAAVTFGYVNPTTSAVNGTVVFFNGSSGTAPAGDATGSTPGETQYINDYLAAGYQIVQVAWTQPWQESIIPWPPEDGPPLGNIQAAACRSATFLNYVFNSSSMYKGVYNNNNKAGMCAQGASAGSAQVAYSLAYFGVPAPAQWWIDNVELISGPVFGDIKQGCEVPAPPSVTVCPSGQWGCQPGTGTSWTLSPTYLPGTNTGVGAWTNDPTCANGQTTSLQSNALWLAQSIVDQGTGATPSFTYSHTAMSAWLCRSVANQVSSQTCSSNYIQNDKYCPNNSSPQGEIFYSQIGQSNSPPSYNVYAVDNCNGPEGASDTQAYVTALTWPPPDPPMPYLDGYDAIKYDMIGGGPRNNVVGCFHKTP
jgi:hypothetical protein